MLSHSLTNKLKEVMNELEQFIANAKNVHGKRVHNATNSYDTKDFYRGYIKGLGKDSKYFVSERKYGEILRVTNDILTGKLLDGYQVVFPYNFGSMQIESFKESFKIVDGKIRTSMMVDWNETLKLWYEDEECRKNKTLVRKDRGGRYCTLRYHRSNGRLQHKKYLYFMPCRRLTNIINKKMEEEGLDVLPRLKYGSEN